MNTQRRCAGFTLIEFVMVVAISGILIAGLSAVIEIPRMALEQRETGQSVSSVDRALSVLDRDIRFASDVRVSDGDRTLEIDASGGGTITYTWGGSEGDPVIRTDGSGASSIASGVDGCRFVLKKTPKLVASGLALSQSDTVIETAAFSGFSLLSGFSWSSIGGMPSTGQSPGLGETRRDRDGGGTSSSTVTQNVGVFGISDLRRPGFFFEPSGLGSDDASCTSFRVRLRRYGTGDLRVRIYEALGESDASPERSELVGLGMVPNASLSSTFEDVTIPLTSVSRMRDGTHYFAELSSDRNDFAAEIQVNTASDANAIVPPNGGVTRSTDSGTSFSSFTASLSTSQAPFSLSVVMSEPITDNIPQSAYDTVYVITAVGLELKLGTADGASILEAAFPLQNNLANL